MVQALGDVQECFLGSSNLAQRVAEKCRRRLVRTHLLCGDQMIQPDAQALGRSLKQVVVDVREDPQAVALREQLEHCNAVRKRLPIAKRTLETATLVGARRETEFRGKVIDDTAQDLAVAAKPTALSSRFEARVMLENLRVGDLAPMALQHGAQDTQNAGFPIDQGTVAIEREELDRIQIAHAAAPSWPRSEATSIGAYAAYPNVEFASILDSGESKETSMLRATQALAHLDLQRPTLLVDAERVRRNITRMARKAAAAGVRFRPHFKTHQSAAIGEWFRDAGVESITVSSLDMARYFADHGWSDITVAFPLNVREMKGINQLAARVTLHVLVDCHDAVQALEAQLTQPVDVWIKVDVGGRRAGVRWTDLEAVMSLAGRLRDNARVRFVGLLTHSGHSYDAEDVHAIQTIHDTTLQRMSELRMQLAKTDIAAQVSIGDTPCCSVADDFPGVDELRPGNFVFYDMTQVRLGACGAEDVAMAVACPVVSKHAERGEIVLYGGAVHLSKDTMHVNGTAVYGYLASWGDGSWAGADSGASLVSLSQEHGVVRLDPQRFDTVEVGDLVAVLPVHSCLTSDLYREYRGLDGARILRRQSNEICA